MNYEGYSAAVTGALAAVITGAAFFAGGNYVGGIFAALCAFVIGMGTFVRVTDAIETYKSIQKWERHRAKRINFELGEPVKGWPGYYEEI